MTSGPSVLPIRVSWTSDPFQEPCYQHCGHTSGYSTLLELASFNGVVLWFWVLVLLLLSRFVLFTFNFHEGWFFSTLFLPLRWDFTLLSWASLVLIVTCPCQFKPVCVTPHENHNLSKGQELSVNCAGGRIMSAFWWTKNTQTLITFFSSQWFVPNKTEKKQQQLKMNWPDDKRDRYEVSNFRSLLETTL